MKPTSGWALLSLICAAAALCGSVGPIAPPSPVPQAMLPQGQPSEPVYPSAQDHFYYKIVEAQIDFERDAAGHVKDLVLHQNGQDVTATR